MANNEGAFDYAKERNPHLKRYVNEFIEKTGEGPEFHIQLSRDVKEIEFPNIVYPVGDPIFVHVYLGRGEDIRYLVIEPELTEAAKEKYGRLYNTLISLVPQEEEPKNPEEFKKMLDSMMNEICVVGEGKKGVLSKIIKTSPIEKIYMSQKEFEDIHYKMMKELVGLGVLEPFIRDPYIEDINCTGLGNIFVIHKLFELAESNVKMETDEEIDEYCYRLSEKLDRPVSRGEPIIDGALPDGSRINIIYSRDISKKGSSFTIRKFSATPLSITQLITWGSMSAQIAAYIWICLENGMSLFVCGETASGKTTTLNAICAFIKPDAKILTVEDTPEVNVPHECWQQLITRGKGRSAGGAVEMYDLLKAALRSRPNYIIVGEIRGAEGNVAFQAMQTGHPCMATFHASSVRKMIQRFTGNPINVPLTFMDNLNLVLIQQAVYRRGKLLRRALELTEIEGYSREADGVLTRTMIEWTPSTDVHVFKGMYNSYILEDKVATMLGYAEKRKIYDEMMLRTRILEEMVSREIFDYFEVFDIIKKYRGYGVEGLPFPLY